MNIQVMLLHIIFIIILLWERRIHSTRIKQLDPLHLHSWRAICLAWEKAW